MCQSSACPPNNSWPVQARITRYLGKGPCCFRFFFFFLGGGGGGNWPWPSGSNLTLKVKFYPIVSLKFVRVVSHHPFKLGRGGEGGDWPWPSGSNLILKVKFYPIVSLKFVRVVSHHPFKLGPEVQKNSLTQTWICRSKAISHCEVSSWDITNYVDKTLTRMLTWSAWGIHDSTNSTNWARNSFTVILWHGDRLWSTCLFTIENGSLDVVILLDITKFLLDRCHHTLWM